MKTILTVLLITSTLLFNMATQAASPKKLHTLLNRIMNYPDFAIKSKATGIVFVSFETRKDGTIKILGLNASSKKFGEHVSKKLSKLQVDAINTTQVYNYKFTFKPEKSN